MNNSNITGSRSRYRLGRNSHRGGILLYIREDIPSKLLVTSFEEAFEAIFIEINLEMEYSLK